MPDWFVRLLFLAACAAAIAPLHAQTESDPKILKEVKPEYTFEARARGIEGEVVLEAEVLTDGTVGDVQVIRSLDREYGLDQEAVKAMQRWMFKPAARDGQPVTVRISVGMTFSLKKK